MKACSVEACDKPLYGKGYCNAHYERHRRHGDPLAGGTSKGATIAWLNNHITFAGDNCLKWPFARLSTGYGTVRFNGTMTTASRAMCILAHGEPPESDMESAHLCGKGHEGCVNPTHLQWATSSENNLQKRDHGTDNRGSKHKQAKLTEALVCEIREVYASGEFTLKDIADELGCDPANIHAITSRRSWKHVA